MESTSCLICSPARVRIRPVPARRVARGQTRVAATARRIQTGGPAELQSQLTQRGRAAAEELRDSVLADPPRREAIEAACPGWRESVRFPFLHTKGTGVRSALERVRERRRRLDVARRRLLDRLYQQESALELFEATLERSLRRLEGGEEEEGSA